MSTSLRQAKEKQAILIKKYADKHALDFAKWADKYAYKHPNNICTWDELLALYYKSKKS